MAKQWLFITGTDTDVGKTVVACGFLAAANQQGLRTAAIKPVAAGCEVTEQGMTNSDALQLQAAASHKLSYQQINPVALEPAIAPHIAAAEAGLRMSASRLVGYCRGVSLMPVDTVVVEGAGGWRVPINSRETLADVARELECAVIVVVGMRLGCLNHSLLTMEAIRRDGLQIAGWVANILDPEMPRLQENIDTLKQCINEPCLGTVPRLDDLSAERVADFLTVPGQ
ncbi:dethiobiotin synthetase [marine gamma proteobacterium HTCC2207]|uniref:ATP-dependent dethiobiotin synthetase BioD n=1 Tax=gamma proteobacterium HTCC2207 TaxID=314287 RepID=Q1YR01_9GAMM|nr:dethiobiotin synthetase [marine gamma proteobacterium HTCC2207] [gamma proteobacterium HTCC2207]